MIMILDKNAITIRKKLNFNRLKTGKKLDSNFNEN